MTPLLRPINAILLGAFTVSTALWTLPYWFVPFTSDHFSYPKQPFPVLSPVVSAGGTPVLQVTRCNATTHPVRAEATRRLQSTDRQTIILPSVTLDIPPGCETVVSRLTPVPVDTPPGIYTLTGTFSSVNAWGKLVIVPWTSEPFEVEKR